MGKKEIDNNKKMYLPQSKSYLLNSIHTAPVQTQFGQTRYIFNREDGINIIIDVAQKQHSKEPVFSLKIMPQYEPRYLRLRTGETGNPYVIDNLSNEAVIGLLEKYLNAGTTNIKENNRMLLLPASFNYIKAFLSGQPTKLPNGTVRYEFDFPNGYSVYVIANMQGTFTVYARGDDAADGLTDLGAAMNVASCYIYKRVSNGYVQQILARTYTLPEQKAMYTDEAWGTSKLLHQMSSEYFNEFMKDDTPVHMPDFKKHITKVWDKNIFRLNGLLPYENSQPARLGM
jgi:hypothetical protein